MGAAPKGEDMLRVGCGDVQQSAAHAVTQSVWKARQALEVALQTLQICEQHMETAIATPQPSLSMNKFGSFNDRQEPQRLLKHLHTRVNECLYNLALADTMDCTRERTQVLREAKGKLFEVTGRTVASGGQLEWPLQGQVLKLQGQVLLELGYSQEAAERYVPLLTVEYHILSTKSVSGTHQHQYATLLVPRSRSRWS